MPEIDMLAPPAPERPQPRRRIALRNAALVAVMLLIGGAGGIVLDQQVINPPATEKTGLPPGMANYEPRTHEERTFLKSLRAPTYSEAIAMSRATGDADLGIAWIQYIAKEDLVLPSKPLSEPMTIGLPAGKKWKGGPLTNVRLVMADPRVGALVLGLRDGFVAYDRWCQPPLSPHMMVSECPHTLPRVSTREQMYRNLRLLREADFAKYPGLRFVPGTVPVEEGNVYLATGDVVLHPEVRKVPVIVMGENARIVGGEFNRTQVVGAGIGNSRQPGYEILRDPVYTATLPSSNRMNETERRIKHVCSALSQEVRQRYYPGACLG